MTGRILMADDEYDFVELLQHRLAERGYEFISAYNGLEALTKARQFKPDLILLDILLPDLDGLSICEILKQQPATKEIPVIFVSALSGADTRRLASAHACDFFSKPVDLPHLEHRIRDLLHGDSSNR